MDDRFVDSSVRGMRDGNIRGIYVVWCRFSSAGLVVFV